MSDTIFPAIVFKIDRELPVPDLKELMNEIRRMTAEWNGEPAYRGVLAFPVGSDRNNTPISGLLLPNDADGMEDVLLSISELTRVHMVKNYDLMAVFDRSRKPKSRIKKSPKPDVDLSNTRYGFDESKIGPEYRYMLEDDAHAEGARWAELLQGFPFADKTAVQNQRWMDIDVIGSLRAKFPLIEEANRLLGGKIVATLRKMSEPQNQVRLPTHWHQAFGRMFMRGRPPGASYIPACNFVTDHFFMLDYIAKHGKPTTQGIASRYSEQIIDQIDPITATAVSYG
ncbi:hypothetical protein LJR098_001104 [Rhizobium sp. LjRoot98]|uniref:hypothetical protein n=1 Tax=Rhizobium sp. LjRoot98 TaxID=3342345 RepID=UPI003ECF8007